MQTEKLYGTALEYAGLTGGETVWDLYCGIGTISLFLAQKAKKVYGVEIVPPAIEDARRNAALNGMENVEFFVGKAEEVLPREYEKNQVYADVIVVDPPRKGCDSVCLDTIVRMQPKRVVYVSCDSATLARDVKYLNERGYAVERVRCCDMFGMSGHVPDDFNALLKLPGVGRKSANLIMGDVFGKPAIVTDTHCIRLVNRIGLVEGIKDPKRVEMALWKLIPPEEGSDFCHRLVYHGREVCTARTKPYCDKCCLQDICAKAGVE